MYAKSKALSETTKEAVHIQSVLIELHISFPSKISMHSLNKSIQFDIFKAYISILHDFYFNCNNTSSIFLAQNHIFHVRTKYIEAKYHFIQE